MGKELVIVHYHLRPGGVRRVIELGTAGIASKMGCDCVRIVAGEAPPDEWFEVLKSKLKGLKFNQFIRPSFGYISEQGCSIGELKKTITRDAQELFNELKKEAVIWFHNPAVGRNIFLTNEFFRQSTEHGIPLIAHHHDWWFENRWQRLDEMFKCGFDSLEKIADVFFNASPNIKHCAINYCDYSILQKYFQDNSAWFPNPLELENLPDKSRIKTARMWLEEELNDENDVWLMPCRVLRRKNIAEAILIKEWINPEAWLATTAGTSSADEIGYANAISIFCKERKIKFKPGIVANDLNKNPPDVYSLIAASDVVLLTSLQEGFGLSYIEAGLMKTPLIARMLVNLEEDFQKFGLKFPHKYKDILIHPDLFSWREESQRQRQIYESWVARLPLEFQRRAKLPEIVKAPYSPEPIPFSKLTLQAQLEVLSHPAPYSFEKCAGLNPSIGKMKKRTETGRLKPVEFLSFTVEALSLGKYSENFLKITNAKPKHVLDKQILMRVQNEFIRKKLSSEFIYPLLIEKSWNNEL
ncbi:MAG: glycosyltransferase [Verrucomicrobiae bacterium]|nr:glycosyltransferase [Verrucomicrobiae bacterium]